MTEVKKEELTVQELQIIKQVMYGGRWTGQEWEQTITPLLNKIARIITARSEPVAEVDSEP